MDATADNMSENSQEQKPEEHNADWGSGEEFYNEYLKSMGHSNNAQHIPVFGILMILFTLYVGLTLHNNMGQCSLSYEEVPIMEPFKSKLINSFNHRMLEQKDSCNDVHIFQKDLAMEELKKKLKESEQEELKPLSNGHKAHNKFNLKPPKPTAKTIAKKAQSAEGDSNNKKSSTAEPIIYLFAFVFVYLLLKAVSDINNHYKTVRVYKP